MKQTKMFSALKENELLIPIREIKHAIKICQKILLTDACSKTNILKTREKLVSLFDKIKQNICQYNARKLFIKKSLQMSEETRKQVFIEKLVLDHLMLENLQKTSLLLKKNSLLKKSSHSVDEITNERLCKELIKIQSSLLKNKTCKQALIWCAENRPRLKRINSNLETELRIQEFSLLCEQGKNTKALLFARKFFVPPTPARKEKFLQLSALLAFRKKIPSFYNYFKTEERWALLAAQFKTDFFTFFDLPNTSELSILLKKGLSCFKTYACDDFLSNECPTCLWQLRKLTKTLPYAQHTNTSFVCPFSGEQITEDNPPLVLQNGMFYCQNTVKKLTDTQTNMFKCPFTKMSFDLNKINRGFIL